MKFQMALCLCVVGMRASLPHPLDVLVIIMVIAGYCLNDKTAGNLFVAEANNFQLVRDTFFLLIYRIFQFRH